MDTKGFRKAIGCMLLDTIATNELTAQTTRCNLSRSQIGREFQAFVTRVLRKENLPIFEHARKEHGSPGPWSPGTLQQYRQGPSSGRGREPVVTGTSPRQSLCKQQDLGDAAPLSLSKHLNWSGTRPWNTHTNGFNPRLQAQTRSTTTETL